MALGIQATSSGTRVLALLVDARLVRWTLGTDHALRSAGGWGTHKLRQAGADGLSLGLATLGIGPTRRWLTGVHIFRCGG